MNGQIHGCATFPPETRRIEGWADARGSMDDMEKWKLLILPGLELSTSQSANY
jgi:hypothetical protein